MSNNIKYLQSRFNPAQERTLGLAHKVLSLRAGFLLLHDMLQLQTSLHVNLLSFSIDNRCTVKN